MQRFGRKHSCIVIPGILVSLLFYLSHDLVCLNLTERDAVLTTIRAIPYYVLQALLSLTYIINIDFLFASVNKLYKYNQRCSPSYQFDLWESTPLMAFSHVQKFLKMCVRRYFLHTFMCFILPTSQPESRT